LQASTDPLLYALAIPAILIAGISKGGFGGGLGVVAAPLLSLAVPPVQAAALMLPILCVMDLIGVWAYRGRWQVSTLKIIVPAAIVGIAVGTASFHYLNVAAIKLLIGLIGVGFAFNYWLRRGPEVPIAKAPSRRKGSFWAAVAGFTSFVAHAGGPPLNVYLLPLRLEKTLYQATTVLFFIIVNYIKLIPYAWLGQFSPVNVATSAMLIPVAFAGMALGIWLHHRVNDVFFYRVCYLLLFGTGTKLLYDGVTELIGSI